MNFASGVRRIALALAASLLLAAPAIAQAYDGDWAGVLEAGPQKLRLALHVKTAAAETTAVLDSLDQDASLPANAVKTDGGELNLLFLSVGGELKVKLTPDGKALTGSWTQGATLPITLTRQATAH
jgi:hypothetical protein